MENGVPLLRSLDLVTEIAGNRFLEAKLGEVRRAVIDGATLSAALQQQKLFPDLFTDMMAVGRPIVTASGIISVANGAAIDFETAPGHTYSLTARATVGALSADLLLTINVGDVNDNAPVITPRRRRAGREQDHGGQPDVNRCRHGRHRPGDLLDQRRCGCGALPDRRRQPCSSSARGTTRPTRTATPSR